MNSRGGASFFRVADSRIFHLCRTDCTFILQPVESVALYSFRGALDLDDRKNILTYPGLDAADMGLCSFSRDGLVHSARARSSSGERLDRMGPVGAGRIACAGSD